MPDFSRKQLYRLDEAALLETVERYRAPLLYFITGYMGNVTDAEDVVSETLVRLLTKKPLLKSEQTLKTYLYKTAKHLAIDRLRKAKREKAFLEESLAKRDIAYIDEAMAKTEEKLALAAALRLLPADYRQVLYFYYFEDLSILEICKILGKNKKQIYNLLARAKAALSTILNKEDAEDEI